jgi:hypothetical protein
MDPSRIVQVLLIGGIVAVIAGSLLVEYYVGPWLRRWRVRRRHRHAAQLLTVYRSLRAHLRERRLAQVLAEDAEVLVAPDGKVIIVANAAVMPVAWGQDN